jgi:hypothetical protein
MILILTHKDLEQYETKPRDQKELMAMRPGLVTMACLAHVIYAEGVGLLKDWHGRSRELQAFLDSAPVLGKEWMPEGGYSPLSDEVKEQIRTASAEAMARLHELSAEQQDAEQEKEAA